MDLMVAYADFNINNSPITVNDPILHAGSALYGCKDTKNIVILIEKVKKNTYQYGLHAQLLRFLLILRTG